MNSLLPKELYFSWEKCKTAAWNSISSRYLVSCIVYFVYSIGMILADGSEVKESERNHFYFQFGVVHLINAVMFMWTWTGKSFADKVMVPEYLNFIGAVLYLWSSTLYGKEYTSDDDSASYSSSFYLERELEFWASAIEVLAAFGWIWSWHVGYMELVAETHGPIPSRGWTFDDPDIAANITIAVAAIIYFAYNWQVFNDYSEYETNQLYQVGDQIYLANSLLYLIAALRDCDWFWFMPKFGQYRTVAEIMAEEADALSHGAYTKVESDSSSLIANDVSNAN